jgi:hypothetical protein
MASLLLSVLGDEKEFSEFAWLRFRWKRRRETRSPSTRSEFERDEGDTAMKKDCGKCGGCAQEMVVQR